MLERNIKMTNKLLNRFVIGSLASVFLMMSTSCAEEDKIAAEIAKIDVNLEVYRFDREFASAKAEGLPKLKEKYPYLFPGPDSLWFAKLKDTLHLQLFDATERTFVDFEDEKDRLTRFFRHARYYFPTTKIPKVITLISDVDYNDRVILADTLLLVGLDNYLGEDHKFYGGIERYIATELDKKYLISNVAGTFAKKINRYPSDRSFLARMVYHGKELYIKDKLIPFESDAAKIGYSEGQLGWAQANEEQIWRYFIERELLYSTDVKLGPRFLDPAPFSKFRLEEIDNESPGRIGRYVGWQIVRAFAENNELSLQQILSLPAEEIFKKSNYKPKK